MAVGGYGRRALLAMLLLDAGRVVPTQRLIDGIYGDEPPAGAGNALQSQVSRLRAALGEAIENQPGGYRLVVDRDEVDVHRFERLAGQGREALAAGEAERGAVLLREALGLWQGDALADVGEAPFAAAQVVRLEELRLGAVEDRVAADLALGGHRNLVAELRELVAAHPLRERLTAQLMRALLADGRQADALAVYETARETLAETLGADPGEELAAAHLAVLRGETPVREGGRVSRETTTFPTAAPTGVSRETAVLPAQLTSFVGRENELALIAGRLRDARLVTLTGPGGAGKTRLSIEAAGRFDGEVCFVPLAGVTDGVDLPQALLGALGLREVGLLTPTGPAQDPVSRLAAALAERPVLLVLDNCEHLIDAAAGLVGTLLTRCPSLKVLATSREAFGITGEALCPVPPLALPPLGAAADGLAGFPAVRLFVERAVAVRPTFSLDDEREAVLRICTALDGQPLALELAAARLRTLSAGEIADRLGPPPEVECGPALRPSELFRLLSRGSRTAQPRQRTLRGVIDWSWDLLTEPERVVLSRASVFAGGWTLEAAEAVCADPAPGAGGAPAGTATSELIEPGDVLDLVDSLVDKSLVVAHQPDGGGGARYRMLETIRSYGAERLAEADGTDAARRRHAAYFLDLAVTAEPRLRRAGQLDWLRRLSAEHDNLHAALHRCVADGDTATGMRLVAALSTYWLLRGARYEGAAPARKLVTAVGPRAPEGLEEEFALCVMTAAPDVADQRELAEHLKSVRATVERGPARYPVMFLLWAPFAGVPDEETYVRQEAALALVEADSWFQALNHIGVAYQNWMVLGEADAVHREFTLARAKFCELGDRWGEALATSHLASFLSVRGELPRAVRLIDEAMALADELEAVESRADLLCERGRCRLRALDHDAACADFRAAADLARRIGTTEFLAVAHLGLAESARLRGALEEADRWCDQAMAESLPAWFAGDVSRTEALVCRGRLHAARGQRDRARECYREAYGARQTDRNRPFTAAVADAAADLALRDGAPERAAELLGIARALRGMEVVASPDAAATETAARETLGEEAYVAARDRGARLDAAGAYAALGQRLAEPGGTV
ncbi:BTAD domain-containing putative transcriptional regulator [Streptomyces sp. ICBB 8177]|uniref:BTAD domain-containing putative transcriptional regulator n=1 Tax=Streptomyces sp. ICBB 8177 TaxID=563922 RepID=UPI001F541524|nr:BTAD domain-containing putative transcriptional regulator [Streptomyces sp. ICBB 8177]